MKKWFILFIGSLIGIASCSYLDVQPVGQVIPESVTEYRAMLTSGYNSFPQYKNLLGVRADEVFPSAEKSSAYNDYISIALWDESNPGAYTPAFPWISMYTAIFYANSVIENIDDASVDTEEDSREQLKAEAYLLRAYAHFELLNLYSSPYSAASAVSDRGVPLSLEIDIEQDYVPETVERVYEQILSDMRDGMALMQVEEQGLNTRYRFSKKAAQALEARVLLYRGDWKGAQEAAEKLLPCELEDLNLSDATAPYRYDSKEAIMTLDNPVDRYYAKGYLFVLPNLMDKYHAAGDKRVEFYYEESDGFYWPKKGSGSDVRMTFRSAEIYLIAAEAAAHREGQLSRAKEYLKQLMEKRLTPEYYAEKAAAVDAMNQAQVIAEIADERARELALEGHRWFDLRRTTRPEIAKEYTDLDGVRQTAVLRENDARYTIRFPQEATENNPNLRN